MNPAQYNFYILMVFVNVVDEMISADTITSQYIKPDYFWLEFPQFIYNGLIAVVI